MLAVLDAVLVDADTDSVVPAVDIYGLRRAGMVIAELAKSVSVTIRLV